MRTRTTLSALAALAVAGCGGDDSDAGFEGSLDAAMEKKDGTAMEKDEAAMKEDEAMEKEDAAMKKGGVTITLQDSNFGPMLFDKTKQNTSSSATVAQDRLLRRVRRGMAAGAEQGSATRRTGGQRVTAGDDQATRR